MLEWKLVMVAACLATTGNHWSTLSPMSPCKVRESGALGPHIITLPGSGRGGVAFPPLAPTYQAMMLEWKLVMVAACLATTGNHWSTFSPMSPCTVR